MDAQARAEWLVWRGWCGTAGAVQLVRLGWCGADGAA